MLPALRQINRSPGLEPVSRLGSMRESEHVINNTSGLWPSASVPNKSLCFGYMFWRKFNTPFTIFSTVDGSYKERVKLRILKSL